MADTKNSDLATHTPISGAAFLYASISGASRKVSVQELSKWIAESLLFSTSSGNNTPTDLTANGLSFSGANGFSYVTLGSAGVTSYRLDAIGYTPGGSYLIARQDNAVLYNPAVPSATRLAADTFTTVASLGASGWSITTTLSPATGSMYFVVVGAAAELTYWTLRLTPLRLVI